MYRSDQDLLLAIYNDKDEKAFKVFYDKYAKLLLNWATKRTGNRDLAEDIVQNFWVIFWTKPHAIKTDEFGVARTYLIHYFTYRMLDYLRTSASKFLGSEFALETMANEDSYLHIIEDIQVKDMLDMIDRVLINFPKLTQDIFKSIWELNLSVKDTSKAIGVSEKVVRTHYKKVLCLVQDHTKTFIGIRSKSFKIFLEILMLVGLLK
ncbi:sigma-70 family RNA polymerase sigma factor [uncultured Formosa sp.]|uniref:RNA polymerase sigma factor n=1 Tax=uncultured Formosa sp. TaxID=255435 RepID=UPI002630DF7F|nr:sigma-70 family RNA polymerase sigma factor [uncultured Formosa sp.]